MNTGKSKGLETQFNLYSLYCFTATEYFIVYIYYFIHHPPIEVQLTLFLTFNYFFKNVAKKYLCAMAKLYFLRLGENFRILNCWIRGYIILCCYNGITEAG